MKKNKIFNWVIYGVILIILLMISSFLSLSQGEIDIPFGHIPDLLFQSENSMEHVVLTQIRLPRILLGIAVGGALSLAGVILQGIYQNPLVEPYTLGISGGAALGVALAIVFGLPAAWGNLSLPFGGFAGALLIIVVVYLIGSRKSQIRIQSMLLTGVMISFITSSSIMLLMSTTNTENLHGIIFWTMGSLDEPNMVLIYMCAIVALVGLVLSYFFIQPLNALRMGEEKAMHVGINTDRSIKFLFVIASVLTGVSVSVAGVIGFVGLIIPHLIRSWVGTDYRILLVSAFLGGGTFLVLSDLASRILIAPNELPVGVITGIIGGSLFIIVLSRSKSLK
ncbi:MAG: iron chelate uptake ABC transporter family permease subunit [Bacteroidetes bacterium]|jgi:iron complex transport system permease protein|nr:iron chelate uptake ABC transporter family permease subunit [Bacteroidota bacterium]